ncbi:MAG: GNAT family N-acetyltransferase [Synergistaceae bacterium]|nr:GNAT family N-acetyltransferase [Synergistaceae bacterium]
MNVSCRKMRAEDFPEAVVIAQKSINDTDAAFYDYIKAMTESLGNGTEGVVAEADGHIAGVMYFISGIHLSGGRTDFIEEINKELNGAGIYSCSIVAVDPRYRGLKISKKLHECAFEILREQNIRHILVEIWIRPDGYMPGFNCIHYAPSFTDYGDIPNYYAEAPEAEGHICSVCGEDCHCAAKIAVMHI